MLKKLILWLVRDEIERLLEQTTRRIEARDEMLASTYGETLALRREVDKLSRALAQLLLKPSARYRANVDQAISELLLEEDMTVE